jgi:hypothetical protein
MPEANSINGMIFNILKAGGCWWVATKRKMMLFMVQR